jgi:hypothetical protein
MLIFGVIEVPLLECSPHRKNYDLSFNDQEQIQLIH